MFSLHHIQVDRLVFLLFVAIDNLVFFAASVSMISQKLTVPLLLLYIFIGL